MSNTMPDLNPLLATEAASCDAMYLPSHLPEQSSSTLTTPSTKRNQGQSPLLLSVLEWAVPAVGI